MSTKPMNSATTSKNPAKHMRQARSLTTTLLLLCCMQGQAQTTNQPELSLNVGYEFSTGRYGTDSDINIGYVPLTIRLDAAQWAVRATYSYVRVESVSPVLLSDNAVVIDGPNQNERRVNAGFLDPVIAATYKHLAIGEGKLWLWDLTGKIKLPLTNKTRGQSTGKADYTLETEVTYDLRPVSYIGGVGYKWRGQDEDRSQRNSAFGFAGAKWHMPSGGKLLAMYDYQQASSHFSSHESELSLTYLHSYTRHQSMSISATKGLSDGSANWSLGLNAQYKY